MALTKEEVLKVAKLARLTFPEERIEKFREELNGILDYIDMLNEVDTEGVEALVNVSDEVNNLREDEVRPSVSAAEALMNAPVSAEGTVVVPKVVGE
ncbi:MAG: Asp-tRNA(Asn)/Glu-tRNA(Gln) amidotransferase subunit GatC [Fusobacteriaceae bacterium]|jgi:aspartyl-tRNA(Asn)/glutamyl-tRNA(Gln) amidotransferase subunit C|nr:Asp-tRNA(Asn)/Glu-tRNA(Gln) amidotransferase subunit GatC [Fusobacteriaceae bacterium]